MNKVTLLLIASVTALLCLLSVIAVNNTNAAVKAEEDKRKQINLLDSIIDKSNNYHPLINKSIKGKVIVISVWASWSQPCLLEVPKLNKLVDDFKSDKVVFVALNGGDSVAETHLMDSMNIHFNYRMLYREQQLIQYIASFELPFERSNTLPPINVVINPEGKIEVFYTGYKTAKMEEMREYLERAVKN